MFKLKQAGAGDKPGKKRPADCSTVVSPVSVRPQFPCTHSFVYFGGSKE